MLQIVTLQTCFCFMRLKDIQPEENSLSCCTGLKNADHFVQNETCFLKLLSKACVLDPAIMLSIDKSKNRDIINLVIKKEIIFID